MPPDHRVVRNTRELVMNKPKIIKTEWIIKLIYFKILKKQVIILKTMMIWMNFICLTNKKQYPEEILEDREDNSEAWFQKTEINKLLITLEDTL